MQELTESELKALDYIVVVDHSGSMGHPSARMPGKNRLEEVQEDCEAIAREAAKYDDDGITVIAFSNGVSTYDGVGAERVAGVFKEFPPRGSTNLTDALRAAVSKVAESSKEGVVLVYTDGQPNDEKSAMAVIDEAGRKLGRPKIGFTFIQVGTDPGATAFLDHLDNDMKVDVTATFRAADAEGKSFSHLSWAARND